MASTRDKIIWFTLGAVASAFYFWQQKPFESSLPALQKTDLNPDIKTALQDIRDLREQIQWQYQGLITEQEQNFNQIQALLSIYYQIRFTAPLPPMKRWSVSPDFINLLITQVRDRKPILVLAAGGGISTLMIAYCLKEQGFGRVIVFDHDLPSASETAHYIQQHELEAYAHVIHTPLQGLRINGQDWVWYDTDPLDDITLIDFLVIDGPPQHNNPISMARYPAMPLVYPLLSENALILLNDARRSDEKKSVEAWLKEFNLVEVAEFDTEKGAILLQKQMLA